MPPVQTIRNNKNMKNSKIATKYTSETVFTVVLYMMVVFFSSSHVLSYMIGIYLCTPFFVSILNGNKETISQNIQRIFTIQSFKLFGLILMPTILMMGVSEITLKMTYIFMLSIILGSLCYSAIFLKIAPHLYKIATGTYGVKMNSKDFIYITILATAFPLMHYADQYMLQSHPFRTITLTTLVCTIHVLTVFLSVIRIYQRNQVR